MTDNRLNKFAKVLINYSIGLKKGERIVLEGNTVSEPLLKELYKEALLAGGFPIITPLIEESLELLYKHGSEDQIGRKNPLEDFLLENTDAILTIWGENNTKALANVDSSKISLRRKARRDYTTKLLAKMGEGTVRWCGTQFPTFASAMDADMSLMEYEDFVFSAGHVESSDPVAEWLKMHDEQQKIVDYLSDKKLIEVKSKDANLTLNVEGRKWINCDGRVNFPDGEVFTSPVESSMNGHIRFSFPAIYLNKEVEDVELTFKDGKVIDAKAKKGIEFLNSILDTDEGARFVGEFAIGTNYNIQKFTKNILFDEKLGGTIHIAIGSSIPESGGKNESAIHWDLICDMKEDSEIYADGELFYKDGTFIK